MSDEHPAPPPRPSAPGALPVPTPSVREPLRPMPARTIALIAAGIFVLTAGLVVALWLAGTAGLSGKDLVTARFDALRTGLSIGIGGGGLFALYLAWRRQHATEVGLVQKERDLADVARAYELQREVAEHTRLHAERVAAATEKDAADRRVTELYTKASEQLGSDKAPVRLAGLYALERLAQDNPHQRQTVVNVLCAYLRMPYTLPGAPPADDADEQARTHHDHRMQEREVRLTAQHILTTHLNRAAGPARNFWSDTDLNLTGATLIDLDFAHCRPRHARFGGATFAGRAWFRGARFMGDAWFNGATFTTPAEFGGAMFTGEAWFDEARFTIDAKFIRARFTRHASFRGAAFTGRRIWFNHAVFNSDVRFEGARFDRHAGFDKAMFTKDVWFDEAMFTEDVRFDEATFTGAARFGKTTFTGAARFDGAITQYPDDASRWPTGWTVTDDHQPVYGREGTWHRLVEVEAALADSP